MFGVFEVEGVHVEGTTPKTVGGVESSNVKNDATPSVEPQAVTDERGPVVTADMVCVTPGLSVTNVYNEVQAQSMHRGRTPAAQQVYANRLLDDNSNTGTENMDPQIEDFTSRSAIPAHMTLHSEADLTQHADVNQTDNTLKTQPNEHVPEIDTAKSQASSIDGAFFDQDPPAMAGFVARLGVSSSSSQETKEETLHI